jgi:phospholipid/cholesterol/gamma-HCH transport system permease protein
MTFSGSDSSNYKIEVDNQGFDRIVLIVSGEVSAHNADDFHGDIKAILATEPLKNVTVSFKEVDYFDTSAAAVTSELRDYCANNGNDFEVIDAPKRVKRFIEAVSDEAILERGVLSPRTSPGIIIQVGQAFLELLQNGRDILTFIGACASAIWEDIKAPKSARWDNFWTIFEKAGSDAIPIVTTLSFLMGAILAFQAAIEMRKFGATIFVANLVSGVMCLEMGPLMVAIIASGRCGAAYAAHIGTMKVTEEIDALRVMAIDPIRSLVTPRIVAVALSLPLLTILADILGILGGCAVGALSLEITPAAYFNQVAKELQWVDFLKGVIKSFFFGILVAMVGCLRGFQARGGAQSVGAATTSAVVTCVFILTVADAIFAVFFYYLPKAFTF